MGPRRLARLTEVFYRHVHRDPLLAPVFAHADADHAHHVAVWLGEFFAGPAAYTTDHGGYSGMLRHHLGLAITPEQRARWAQLIADAADEAGLPADPEFRSAFVTYVEWARASRWRTPSRSQCLRHGRLFPDGAGERHRLTRADGSVKSPYRWISGYGVQNGSTGPCSSRTRDAMASVSPRTSTQSITPRWARNRNSAVGPANLQSVTHRTRLPAIAAAPGSPRSSRRPDAFTSVPRVPHCRSSPRSCQSAYSSLTRPRAREAWPLTLTDRPAQLVVPTPGVDGELAESALLTRLADLGAERLAHLTGDQFQPVHHIFAWHPSEASGLLAAAASGILGSVEVRDAGCQIHLTDTTPIVFAVDAHKVAASSPAAALCATTTLGEAQEIVRQLTGISEIDYETTKVSRLRDRRPHLPTPADLPAIDRYAAGAASRSANYVTRPEHYKPPLYHVSLQQTVT